MESSHLIVIINVRAGMLPAMRAHTHSSFFSFSVFFFLELTLCLGDHTRAVLRARPTL